MSSGLDKVQLQRVFSEDIYVVKLSDRFCSYHVTITGGVASYYE